MFLLKLINLISNLINNHINSNNSPTNINLEINTVNNSLGITNNIKINENNIKINEINIKINENNTKINEINENHHALDHLLAWTEIAHPLIEAANIIERVIISVPAVVGATLDTLPPQILVDIKSIFCFTRYRI